MFMSVWEEYKVCSEGFYSFKTSIIIVKKNGWLLHRLTFEHNSRNKRGNTVEEKHAKQELKSEEEQVINGLENLKHRAPIWP